MYNIRNFNTNKYSNSIKYSNLIKYSNTINIIMESSAGLVTMITADTCPTISKCLKISELHPVILDSWKTYVKKGMV